MCEVAEQCGRRGVRSLVVITSGLGEAGPDLLATCRDYGMRLVGPNCFGIAVPGIGLDATFGRDRAQGGTAGLAVQSGGIGVSLTEHLSRLGIGVSSFVSVGDKYDVSGNDLLTWWEQDQHTGWRSCTWSRSATRASSPGPPGGSASGCPCSRSSAAGRRRPARRQVAHGRRRHAAGHPARHCSRRPGSSPPRASASSIGAAAFLSCQPCPAGTRVAVVSNAGGAGVLAADACGDDGLVLAPLSEPTRQRLAEVLPAGATIANPVDTTAAIDALAAFRACLEDGRRGRGRGRRDQRDRPDRGSPT